MLVAVTGYADASWRPSAWYLTILEDLQLKAGQAKLRKRGNFLLEWRKLVYVPGRIGAATSRPYLVAFRQDTRNVQYVACSAPKCDFGAARTPN